MLTLGEHDRTGGAQPSRHEPAPITFIAGALTLLLLVLLAVLVFVAVWTARGAAKRATCTSQLRQLANAFAMYRNEHGAYPPGSRDVWNEKAGLTEHVTWEQMLQPYVGSEDVFHCPCDTAPTVAADQDAAERPTEPRAHSYQYVRAEAPIPPVSGDSRAAPAPQAKQLNRSEAIRHGVLLVCRRHDTATGRTGRRVLVAYEDGSVKWERPPEFLVPKRQPLRQPEPGRNDW